MLALGRAQTGQRVHILDHGKPIHVLRGTIVYRWNGHLDAVDCALCLRRWSCATRITRTL